MASAVAYVVSWSSRHRAIISAATLAIVLISLAGIRGLSFDTDVLSLLPRDGTAVPAFRKFLATFGSLDQLYIVFTTPAGQSVADYEEQIDAWIDALRQAPEIVRVDSGTVDASRDVRWLADHQLLLFPESTLTQALARFHGAGMRQAIAARRQLLEAPSPEITELVRQDPLGLLDMLRDHLGGSPAAGLHIGVTGRGYVTTDGRRRLIIAQPRRPPFDSDFSHALFARLAAIQETVSRRPPADQPGEGTRPRLEVEMAGGHRIALETEATVRRESISNTVGSLALILPLLYIGFRSPWLIAVGSLPSIIALLIVLGAFGFAGVTLSVATAASAAMLFGLGIDGVVLLYVAYNRAIAAGADPVAAIDGLASPSFSMLLGMWTTAATFYGLGFVDFPSLTQLGQLIGHSMMLCAFLTLVLVPATLRRRRPRHPPRSLSMPAFSERVQSHRRTILWGALILTVGLGAAATKLRINPTLDRLKSVTPGAVLQEQLTSMFGLPGEAYVVIDEGPDLESLLAANERLMAEIARTTTVLLEGASTLLPSQATQSQRAVRIQEAGLSSAAVATALADAGAQAGFRADAFDPFRERLPRLLDATQRLTYQGYHEHGLGDLLDHFVARTGTGWRLASYAFPSTDAQVAAIEAAIRSVDRTAAMTGVPFVNRELAARFLPQFVRGVVIGTAIVILIVVWAFRDWWLSLLALLPTAIGLIWAAGVLGLAGSELDLFAVFAVVTFVGIGVDYGIHLVQRYRETGDARRAVEELAPVVLVAAGITILGYGTLVTSSYPPLRSIGLVSSVSVATLSLASVIVLPTLLMGIPKRHEP